MPTATRATSTRKAVAKKPQDHQPKAAESAIDDGEVIIEFEFEGIELTGYGDSVTGETMEALGGGDVARFVKDLLGPDQWNLVKGFPIRKLGKLVEVWGKASEEMGNS